MAHEQYLATMAYLDAVMKQIKVFAPQLSDFPQTGTEEEQLQFLQDNGLADESFASFIRGKLAPVYDSLLWIAKNDGPLPPDIKKQLIEQTSTPGIQPWQTTCEPSSASCKSDKQD